MATLSIRIPDCLKEDVVTAAKHQGVSMNNYITSCLSAAVAQEATRDFFARRLKNVDQAAAREAFESLLARTRPGEPPSATEIKAQIESSRQGS